MGDLTRCGDVDGQAKACPSGLVGNRECILDVRIAKLRSAHGTGPGRECSTFSAGWVVSRLIAHDFVLSIVFATTSSTLLRFSEFA